MNHTNHGPYRNSLSTLPLWQAVSLCVGLVLLALPLIVLPGVIAASVRASHPLSGPTDVAVIGIALSLCTFRALAPALGVPLRDVFVRRPDRSIVGWAVAGLLAPGTIAIGATAIAGGDVTGPTVGVWTGASVLSGAALLASWPAVLEEFLVRGYLLGVIGHRWNWAAGIAASAAVFALLHHGHATGPWSLLLYVATTGTAGVLFALVTVSSGNVWNAVALHAGWNTAFSANVLAFRTPAEPAVAALVTVELSDRPSILGGAVVDVPQSPLAVLVLLLAVGIVVVTDRGWPIE